MPFGPHPAGPPTPRSTGCGRPRSDPGPARLRSRPGGRDRHAGPGDLLPGLVDSSDDGCIDLVVDLSGDAGLAHHRRSVFGGTRATGGTWPSTLTAIYRPSSSRPRGDPSRGARLAEGRRGETGCRGAALDRQAVVAQRRDRAGSPHGDEQVSASESGLIHGERRSSPRCHALRSRCRQETPPSGAHRRSRRSRPPRLRRDLRPSVAHHDRANPATSHGCSPAELCATGQTHRQGAVSTSSDLLQAAWVDIVEHAGRRHAVQPR